MEPKGLLLHSQVPATYHYFESDVYAFLVPHKCYMLCPSHSSRFDQLNNVG